MTAHNKFGVHDDFFKRLREGSRIKQRIVTHYFVAYNRKLARSREKVGYADLFAGPGSYQASDGSVHKSIPLQLCETIVANELFRDRVHVWFNEADPKSFEQLKAGVKSVHGIGSLRYEPRTDNKIVTAEWAPRLRKLSVPTLVFLDPCGYKGLSLGLVTAILQGFGNDCIFFFNYSRIDMKLDLEIMNESIDEFFETARAHSIRQEIKNRSPRERETIILKAVAGAIEQAGAIPLTFRFKSDKRRTSHHLIYASKTAAAASMMKRILNSASSAIDEGVGSHEHDPQSKSSSLLSGLYEVEERLLEVFSGRNLTFGELLEEEQSQTRFTDTNYRDALLRLEGEGVVTTDPSAQMRPFQPGQKSELLRKTYDCNLRAEESMANKSSIEWTEATWNPSTGCDAISPGCDNCYGERLANRLRAMGQKKYANGFQLTLHPNTLQLPLQWKEPQTIFVNSMSDLFHHDVPLEYIQRVFDVMRAASWHRFQVLTKRSGRLLALSDKIDWPLYV